MMAQSAPPEGGILWISKLGGKVEYQGDRWRYNGCMTFSPFNDVIQSLLTTLFHVYTDQCIVRTLLGSCMYGISEEGLPLWGDHTLESLAHGIITQLQDCEEYQT